MAEVVVPAFKKRTLKATARKRPATPPPDDSPSESDYTDDETGGGVKRRKKEGLTVSSKRPHTLEDLSKSTAYQADRAAVIATSDDATKTSHWYTEAADEAAEARRAARARQEDVEADGNYKGAAGYSNYIQKHADASSRQVGPVKAPTNVRMVTVMDFAPDVCKDYKQTGFCGFGDSCKFLHAREDYKQGWQLDKEWEKAGQGKKGGVPGGEGDGMDADDKLLESIPFACIICKEAYKRPVVTKCGHYFCERCAMTRYMKEKKKTCANCSADTHGTFNTAKKLNELLERKKKRREEKKAEAREAGEEVSEDDDDDDLK